MFLFDSLPLCGHLFYSSRLGTLCRCVSKVIHRGEWFDTPEFIGVAIEGHHKSKDRVREKLVQGPFKPKIDSGVAQIGFSPMSLIAVEIVYYPSKLSGAKFVSAARQRCSRQRGKGSKLREQLIT